MISTIPYCSCTSNDSHINYITIIIPYWLNCACDQLKGSKTPKHRGSAVKSIISQRFETWHILATTWELHVSPLQEEARVNESVQFYTGWFHPHLGATATKCCSLMWVSEWCHSSHETMGIGMKRTTHSLIQQWSTRHLHFNLMLLKQTLSFVP